MSNYFSKMPNISYSGIQVKDITRRSAFISSVLSNPYAYLPYTVKEGEKPEDIAYYYYGSVDYTWLVLLANNIVDSYYDWPLDDKDFNEYIIKKYESVSGNTGYDVVAWAQNETIDENILYYYKEVDQVTLKANPESFETTYSRAEDGMILRNERGEPIVVERVIPEGWLPVRVYEYEQYLNENKREIRLIDRQYRDQIDSELTRLMR